MKVEEVQYKLLSKVQSLPPEIALDIINNALRNIYEEHDWSFLYERGWIKSPALISTGTVNVNKFSNQVAVSSDLKAILDAVSVNDVPIVGRQFRTFGGQIAGSNFIYTITNYDSVNSLLTIDPFYQDANNTAASFQIFKSYYTAPNLVVKDSNGNILFNGIDFANFEYIYSPFAQKKVNLNRTRADLDYRDFARQTQGDPYWAVGYGQDSSGNRLFEFYPIPIYERVYQVLYKREGKDLEPDDVIPSTLNYQVVLAKAKLNAYEWLMINGDKVGNNLNYKILPAMMAMLNNPSYEESYPKQLEAAKNKDEDLFPRAIIDMANVPYYEDGLPIVETVLLDF